MRKQILAVLGAVALITLVAVPALAVTPVFDPWWTTGSDLVVKIENKDVNIINDVVAVAETGKNVQKMKAEGSNEQSPLNSFSGLGNGFGFGNGFGWGNSSETSVEDAGQTATTGTAEAYVDLTQKVNGFVWDVNCDCFKDLKEVSVKNDNVDIDNDVEAIAKTGDNVQRMKAVGTDVSVKNVGQTVTTGNTKAWPTLTSWVNWTEIK